MLVISFFEWWYERGFKNYLSGFVNNLKDLADFFSIRLLVKTLFAPFRQIGVERRANIPLNVRIREWADLQVSRLVGATVRFFLLIIGTLALVLRMVVGLVIGILWPLMPLLIVYSIMLYARGVVF